MLHSSGVRKYVNGDKIISVMTTGAVQQLGWMDRSTLSEWYKEDPDKNHIGMVDLFTNFAGITVPMLKNLFDKKAVISVNGMDGKFTYDIPMYVPSGTFTMKDTGEGIEAPGIDESYFTIALSKAFNPGDVLSYAKDGKAEQVVVSEDHQVIAEGDYFLHTVQMNTTDKKKYFPKEKLKGGIQYWRIGHVIGEFSEQFTSPDVETATKTIRAEFELGNHRGVEVFTTMYADKKSYSGAASKTKNLWNHFAEDMNFFTDELGRSYDMLVVGKVNSSGKVLPSTVRIGATLEYLCLLENMKLEANQLLFQKGGIVKSINGTKRLNEGILPAIRRGRKITYNRPGGITRSHLQQASSYVFQGRQDLQPMQRRLKFKGGWVAYQNIMSMFREEANLQIAALAPLLGNDRVLPKNPVGGALDKLTLEPVKWFSVNLPDIGQIEVEWDPTMDFTYGADRTSRGFTGQGYPKTSGTLMIWNAASEEYSNARTNLPEGVTLVDGGNKKSNIYYVKPEGEGLYWGTSDGRYSPTTAAGIKSSLKKMGYEFWVHSASAAWIRDTSAYLIIELA